MSRRKQKKPDRLELEAAAATAAGMSYGKWKGLQYEQRGGVICSRRFRADEPEVPEVQRADDADGTPRCLYCKKQLTGRQVYWCSSECRYRYRRRLDGGRPKEEKHE